MAYNVFPYSSSEVTIFLMFGWDAYMPTLFQAMLTKIRYMADEKYRIHLDAMGEIYIMTGLNLKTVRDKCPPPSKTLMKLTSRCEIWSY